MSRARRIKAEQNIGLFVVDYLQLVATVRERGESREQEVSKISRFLKGMARELEVPVMACAMLGRAVEQRGGDKRPILSDLRESGQIEGDADLVLFLYRPEMYGIENEEGGSQEGVAEVIIGKQRNGPLGGVTLTFLKEFGRFEAPEMYREGDGF